MIKTLCHICLFPFLLLLLSNINGKSQIISKGADTVVPAVYTSFLSEKTDTITTNDTLLITNHLVEIQNDTLERTYQLREDTIYTADSAYYIYNDTLKTPPFGDTTYYLSTKDSSYFYRLYDYNHYIYIFNLTQGSSDTAIGNLKATIPADTGKGDFTWLKYNEGQYDTIKRIQDQDSTRLDSLTSGGYRVDITSTSSNDTALYAWIFVNDPFLSLDTIKKGPNNDTLIRTQHDCEQINLLGEGHIDTFRYYDVFEDTLITMPNQVKYTWSSNNKDVDIPERSNPKTRVIKKPPYEDTRFYFEARDSMGCKREDTVYYPSIVTKAEFIPYYRESEMIAEFRSQQNRYTKYEDSKGDSLKGSSPLKTLFVDTSRKVDRYEWFLDDPHTPEIKRHKTELGQTSIRYDTSHIFYVPDEYEVTLVTHRYRFNWSHCRDTFRLNNPVKVRKSELKAPNFFSPFTKDNANDRFRVYSPSIRTIHITIFNRWGNSVYDYEGSLEKWEGWNGRVNNSNRKAKPGIYYYVVKALGWEKSPPKRYRGEKYTGFFHLYP